MTTQDKIDLLKMDRRTFLKMASAAGASVFLNTYHMDIARAIEESNWNIVWLHGSECTGCSVSFLNGEHPDVLQAVKHLNVVLQYHETLMTQQGLFVDGQTVENAALNANYALEQFLASGEPYILVVEGGIPLGPDGTGNYLKIAGKPFVGEVRHVAENALVTVAIGACATYGGMPAADPNPTDVVGVQFSGPELGGALGADYRSKAGLPVVNIPGCPSHPDWVLLTLAAVILDKVPGDFLDEYQRPKLFFPPTHTVHENCPRRGFYDQGKIDTKYAEGGCLWDLGCRAMLAHSDCALRLWNDNQNMCTQAGAPCIACVEPTFPDVGDVLDLSRNPKMAGAAGIAAGIAAQQGRKLVSKEE